MNRKLQSYAKTGVNEGENSQVCDILLLISKFKFISKMQTGEKMNVDSLSLVSDNWFTSLFRTINKTLNQSEESKDKTLSFIEDLYEEADICVKSLSQEEDSFYTEMGLMIIDAMKEAKNGGSLTNAPSKRKSGVDSLLHTYAKDKMFVSKVETFLKVTDAKIRHLEAMYNEIEAVGGEDPDVL
ncbi:MAG TPA: hypothetical protein PKD85_01260 [Saprospiraceae bacterium]|nr:hypothetical protein [Saprospiraceae bacterium]